MLVVDASVLATAFADDGPDGDAARSRLRDEELAAPELIDLEVVSVLRRQLAIGSLDERRARLALQDLIDVPMLRSPHRQLLDRCWELRENVTVYDASYIALAEALETRFLTADTKLAGAAGPRCEIEVLARDHRPTGSR